MTEPAQRQVLYGLVSGAVLVVTLVLVIGAGVAGVVPGWWTGLMLAVVVVAAVWSGVNWRKTIPVLGMAVGLFLVWAVGTLVLASS